MITGIYKLSDLMYNQKDENKLLVARESHYFFIQFVGSLFLQYKKKMYEIKKSQCICVLPNNIFKMSTSQSARGIVITFSPNNFPEKVKDLIKKSIEDNPIQLSERQLEYCSCIQQLNKNSTSNNFDMENSMVLGLFQSILSCPTNVSKPSSRDLDCYKEITKFMNSNIDTKLTLDDISEHFSISKQHLIRIFKKVSGSTPHSYFNNIKITKATTFLLSTKDSIESIGERLFFSDASHFIRVFKKYMHMSPTKYRTLFSHKIDRLGSYLDENMTSHIYLLEHIIDTFPDLIFYKNKEGVLLGCNKAFCEVMNLSKNDIIGKTDFHLFEREKALFFQKIDRAVLQAKKPRRNIETMMLPNGEAKLFEVYKAPFFDIENNPIGLIGISRLVIKK